MTLRLKTALGRSYRPIGSLVWFVDKGPHLVIDEREYVRAGYALLDEQEKYPELFESFSGQTPTGLVWTPRESSFGTTNIWDVAYGDGLFVAVGDAGKLATSPDGINWTQRTSSFGTSRISRVAYGNGLWVAVGDAGKLATSPDGIVWTQRTSGFGTSTIQGISYGGGVWVAVGNAGKISTSTNGTSWTLKASGDDRTIWASIYNDELGIWIIGGAKGYLATSDNNGETWTTSSERLGTRDIYGFHSHGEIIVAVTQALNSTHLATSRDGYHWRQHVVGAPSFLRAVTFGDGLWVATGASGGLFCSTSTTDWSMRDSQFGSTIIRGVAYGNGRFVIVGEEGKIATSEDKGIYTPASDSLALGYVVQYMRIK